MPSVIEAPETVEQERVEQAHQTLPSISAPRLGFICKLTALLGNVLPRHKPHCDRQGLHCETLEMPLDILARQHPFLYIKAMSG